MADSSMEPPKPEGEELIQPTFIPERASDSPASDLAVSATPDVGASSQLPRRNVGVPPVSQGGAAKRGERHAAQREDQGAALERRVARVEFAQGALARLRVPVRVDAEPGRDVLTDLDVLAIDIDLRLRITRSILECKSGQGQAKEPDKLLWLSGLTKFVGADRATLVRQTASQRGRDVAASLGLQVLDLPQLEAREAAHAWLPSSFAHVGGTGCSAAESRADDQAKKLNHIPSELIAFLRHGASLARSDRILIAIINLEECLKQAGSPP